VSVANKQALYQWLASSRCRCYSRAS